MNLPITCTVRELREMLEEFKDTPEDELPVFACYNYGDYANTPAVQPLGHAKVRHVQEEAYSRSGFGVAPEPGDDDQDGPEDEDDIDEEDSTKALILSEFEYIPRGR